MSEYIVNVPDEEAECFIARFGLENVKLFGYSLTGEIVRCRDCAKWATEKRFTGKCCGPNGDADPDGFCSYGERKETE